MTNDQAPMTNRTQSSSVFRNMAAKILLSSSASFHRTRAGSALSGTAATIIRNWYFVSRDSRQQTLILDLNFFWCRPRPLHSSWNQMLVPARANWLLMGDVIAFRQIAVQKRITVSPNFAVRSARSNSPLLRGIPIGHWGLVIGHFLCRRFLIPPIRRHGVEEHVD